MTDPTPTPLWVRRRITRDIIFLHKSVWPLREVTSGLERGESFIIPDSTVINLRDIYDHTMQVIDTIETFQDMHSGMLDIYLSSISNRLNSVMKVLTMIAIIFMLPSFIVGLYGMNFNYMPEHEWRRGYPVVLVVMAVIAGWMLVLFRRGGCDKRGSTITGLFEMTDSG